MNKIQRQTWDAEFGKPKFPYFGYSCKIELSEADYESMRQHQLSKLAWCERFREKMEKVFVAHFLRKK